MSRAGGQTRPHIQSPMNQVPSEILSIIFSLSCDIGTPVSFQGPAADTNSARNYTALALSHVCSHWRAFVLASPDLWSRIIVRERLSHERAKVVERIVDLYLTRSESIPLDFVIEFPELGSCEPSLYDSQNLSTETYNLLESFFPIYNLFSRHGMRWRRAYLTINTSVFQKRHNSYWSDTFPLLEALWVHVLGCSRVYSGRLEIMSAPFLKELIHTGAGVSIGPGYGVAVRQHPLPTLESLLISGEFYGENISLACPNTSVTLSFISAFASIDPVVCLAHSLRIELPGSKSYSEMVLGFMCDRLILPNITQLRVELSPTEKGDPYGIYCPAELLDLISKSTHSSASTSLTHLTLISLFIQPSILLSILYNLPALTCFALGESSGEYINNNDYFGYDDQGLDEDFVPRDAFPVLTEAFFQSLTRSNHSNLLPNLKELQLAFGFGPVGSACMFTESRAYALLTMLDSRLATGHLCAVRLLLPRSLVVESVKEQATYWMKDKDLDFNLELVESRKDWRRLGLGNWE